MLTKVSSFTLGHMGSTFSRSLSDGRASVIYIWFKAGKSVPMISKTLAFLFRYCLDLESCSRFSFMWAPVLEFWTLGPISRRQRLNTNNRPRHCSGTFVLTPRTHWYFSVSGLSSSLFHAFFRRWFRKLLICSCEIIFWFSGAYRSNNWYIAF